MNSSAIIMLTVSLVTVWGGLVASVVHLMKHTKEYKD
ncbi:methionine/alanine import family NSS transporter small subunit [Arcanobacterium hippocoleae]